MRKVVSIISSLCFNHFSFLRSSHYSIKYSGNISDIQVNSLQYISYIFYFIFTVFFYYSQLFIYVFSVVIKADFAAPGSTRNIVPYKALNLALLSKTCLYRLPESLKSVL